MNNTQRESAGTALRAWFQNLSGKNAGSLLLGLRRSSTGYAFDDATGYGWHVHYGVMDSGGVFHEFGDPNDDYADVTCSNTTYGPEQLADHSILANVNADDPQLNAHNKGVINLVYDFPGYVYSAAYMQQAGINGGSRTQCSPALKKHTPTNASAWGIIKPTSNSWANMGEYYPIDGSHKNGDIYICYEAKPAATQGGQSAEILDLATLTQPEVNKSVSYNSDGTATLTLSVTGHEAAAQQHGKADVIVVLDLSSSMNKESPPINRLKPAKEAINSFAHTVLGYNPASGDPDIRIGILTFGAIAQKQCFSDGSFYTASETAFRNLLGTNESNGLTINKYFGTTNWEDALLLANSIETRTDADTYILFVTDGDPTVRNTRGEFGIGEYHSGYDDTTEKRFVQYYGPNDVDIIGHYAAISGVYGVGPEYEDNTGTSRCFDVAAIQAEAIYSAGKHFYSINCLGTATRMTGITTVACGGDAAMGQSHSFDATNPDALNAAFEEIIQEMKGYVGYRNVVISDEITDLTNLDGKVSGTTVQFTYTRTYTDAQGGTHTDEAFDPADLGIAEARYENGSVVWELGESFELEDGVTYKVSCMLWPDQDAYDAVADFENGDLTEQELKALGIEKNGGSYTVDTNADEVWSAYTRATVRGSTVTPRVVFRPEGNTDYGSEYASTQGVHFSGDTYVDEASGTQITVPYSSITRTEEPLIVMPMALAVEKSWQGAGNGASFAIQLLRDGTEQTSLTIDTAGQSSPASSDPEYVALGLIHHDDEGNVRVLENGHLYSLEENDPGWTFVSAGEYRMMAIGKAASDSYVPAALLKQASAPTGMDDDAVYYSDGSDEYYRIDGGVYKLAETGDPFSFTAENTPVTTTANATKAWVNADGTTTAPNGASVVFTLYADNAATSYTVTLDGTAETTVPTGTGGYESEPWKATFVNLQKYQTGTSTEITYTIGETGTWPGYMASPTTPVASGGTITNTQETTAVTVIKAWDDNNSPRRPTSVTVKLLVDGAEVGSVELNEGNRWTHTWTNLPLKDNSGRAIVYAVSEDQVPGYQKPVIRGGPTSFTVTNRLRSSNSPFTGDNRAWLPWVGVLLLSGAALGVDAIVRKRRRKDRD